MPTLAPAMRHQPLPNDTLVVIRIAAGCVETCGEAVKLTGMKSTVLQQAAVVYLQQILFASTSDSHRVLGVSAGVSRSEMREHFRWLMTWLHPDRNSDEWESVFAARVIKAWRDVSASSSQTHRSNQAPKLLSKESTRVPGRRPASVIRWIPQPLDASVSPSSRRRRTVAAALVSAFGFVFLFLLVTHLKP
jgi:hypothetical protein